MVLQIPSGFGKDISTGQTGKLLATVDAINASSAQLSWAYLNGVIRDYNVDLIRENINIVPLSPVPAIQITNRYWYNEELNYKYYMLPGILVILVTAIGFLLAGLNMVQGERNRDHRTDKCHSCSKISVHNRQDGTIPAYRTCGSCPWIAYR